MNIAPSEFWALEFDEIFKLLEVKESEDIDISLMLNYERVRNGASKEWLQNR